MRRHPLPFLLLLSLFFSLVLASRRRLIPFASPSTRQNKSCPVVLTQTPARPSRPSVRLPAPRIIGGLAATPYTLSYIVSFADASNRFACSGSLLSARWVLTAAHCGVRTTWSARVGPRLATTGPTTPIARVITHEWFDDARMDAPGDVAVVELANDVPLSANYVTINTNGSVPLSGSFGRVAGYGKTLRADQDALSPAPNQVDGPVNNPDKCSKIYKGYLDVKRKFFICVGYGKSGCQADSCHGDSGGPLVQFDKDNRPVQVGIVSFGLDCGAEGVPGVYVRVAPFVQWLENNGVVFSTSSVALAQFAEGSKEAASDEASVTVLQVIENQLNADAGAGELKISKVTFAVICVIAGIALIGLIFLSLFFVSGRGRSRRREEEESRDLSTDGVQGSVLSVPPTGDPNRDNLQLAISLLQAISEEQGRNVAGSSREPLTVKAEGLEDSVQPRSAESDARDSSTER